MVGHAEAGMSLHVPSLNFLRWGPNFVTYFCALIDTDLAKLAVKFTRSTKMSQTGFRQNGHPTPPYLYCTSAPCNTAFCQSFRHPLRLPPKSTALQLQQCVLSKFL